MGDLSTWSAVFAVVAVLVSAGASVLALLVTRSDQIELRIGKLEFRYRAKRSQLDPDDPDEAAKIVERYLSENAADRKGASE